MNCKEWPGDSPLQFRLHPVGWNAAKFRDASLKVQPVGRHELDPAAARVELYADAVNGDGPVRQEMESVEQLAGTSNGYTYRAPLFAARPAGDYTARVIPACGSVASPLEAACIVWQR